jgi:predicted GIY-YIG superfamily endonuclease
VWAHAARPSGVRCPGAGRAPWGAPEPAEPAPLPGQWIAPSPLIAEQPAGTVYLIHLDAPFGHARHYLGWASSGNLSRRLAHHAAGAGANLLRHVAEAGIGWSLARTWPGDRTRERQLKSRGATRRCPVCRPSLGGRLTATHVKRLVASADSVRA